MTLHVAPPFGDVMTRCVVTTSTGDTVTRFERYTGLIVDILNAALWFAIGIWALIYSAFGLLVDWPFAVLVVSLIMLSYYRDFKFTKYGPRFFILTTVLVALVALSYIVYFEAHGREAVLQTVIDSGECLPSWRFPEIACE